MKIDNKIGIEIVTAAAIVASLIFVGMQLMLDRNVALGAQYAARSESLKEDLRTQMESDGFMSARINAWESGFRPAYWKDELEAYARERNFSSADINYSLISGNMRVLHMDNLYFQYQKGLLDDLFWEKQVASLKSDMKDPIYRALYLENPRGLESLLVDLLSKTAERVISKTEASGETTP